MTVIDELTLPKSFVQADYTNYTANVTNGREHYRDWPRTISIETQVRCNAKCGFCPYPISPRQGEEMSTELFHKIIEDLSVIPDHHRVSLTLHRINEPLLDRRMEAFHDAAADKLPSATLLFWSNGTTLREGKFEWINKYPRAQLHISLNAVTEDEHVRLMGFGLERVLINLDYLHALKSEGKFAPPVALHAPFENAEQAWRVHDFCEARYPLFNLGIRPFFVWMGDIKAGESDRDEKTLRLIRENDISGFPCAQWYDLHVLANGFVTKCCIDEKGYVGDVQYDTRHRNVIDIYRQSRSLRDGLPARRDVAGCEGCTHLG